MVMTMMESEMVVMTMAKMIMMTIMAMHDDKGLCGLWMVNSVFTFYMIIIW